jgi:hypothetical protein
MYLIQKDRKGKSDNSEDRALWYILKIKANEVHYFSTLFGKEPILTLLADRQHN